MIRSLLLRLFPPKPGVVAAEQRRRKLEAQARFESDLQFCSKEWVPADVERLRR